MISSYHIVNTMQIIPRVRNILQSFSYLVWPGLFALCQRKQGRSGKINSITAVARSAAEPSRNCYGELPENAGEYG